MRNYSWKTTAAAIAGIVTTILTLIVTPLLDNDPATKPRYDEAIAIIFASSAGLWARDDDKRSEDVGAGK